MLLAAKLPQKEKYKLLRYNSCSMIRYIYEDFLRRVFGNTDRNCHFKTSIKNSEYFNQAQHKFYIIANEINSFFSNSGYY